MKKKKQILSSSWYAASDDNMAALNGQYAQGKIANYYIEISIKMKK